MKRRKKRKLNLALLLMVVTSICLSTLQVGFSFFDTKFLIGGVGTISYTPGEETAADTILEANSAFIANGSGDASGNIVGDSGYTQVVRADKNTPINNYIKFADNATELWRIVGFTEYGIKIVKDQTLTATSASVWNTASSHWVAWDSFNSRPHQISVTSLTNASTLCTYLNTTYYQSLTNPSSVNYINPDYINHEAVWDLTPMNYQGKAMQAISGVGPQSVTCKATVSGSFVGLPVGLLNVFEFSFTASSFATTTGKNLYAAAFAGWLNPNTNEMSLTETMKNAPTGSSISSQVACASGTKFIAVQKSSTSGYTYRPALYLFSDVRLTTVSGASGDPGSSTNPFVVSGR